ncbi:17419_t:CDS:2, partial [Rhizophagus irregularis]
RATRHKTFVEIELLNHEIIAKMFLFSPPNLNKTCHPDACALFLGGDNLADLQSKVIEDWIRVNNKIPQDFIHVIKKKRRNSFYYNCKLPSIVEENEIELHMEGEEIIISGKYKELNFDGDILKKLIPVGNFEYTFTLPSKTKIWHAHTEQL